jgi:diaminohydroxyphosphoribosylaminopyrimidine deaminase/5-amino-6-(5-phosphoribosylamino)uracil reductase
MVGAVIASGNRTLGKGWHRAAGRPHAEIEALSDARSRGQAVQGATLYVTLEPCSTHGRTPPCVDAIVASGIRRVVAAATDPNPAHAGRGFELLRASGIDVRSGVLEVEAARLNAAFNHWIVHRTPWVTVKAAMTLDGKIASASGESQWITAPPARAVGQRLRLEADAILVGVNTVVADDPSLTARTRSGLIAKPLRRIILDSRARTPLRSRVLSDEHAATTTVVLTDLAPRLRAAEIRARVAVIVAPVKSGRIDLPWLMQRLGRESVTHLLVEGGGEVNASFLFGALTHRVVFFYAPKILGGRDSLRAVGGAGAPDLASSIPLIKPRWRRVGPDLMLSATVGFVAEGCD